MRIVLAAIWGAALLFALRLAFVFIDAPVPIDIPLFLLGTYLPAFAVLFGWLLIRWQRFGKITSFLMFLLSVPAGLVLVFSAPQVQHATAGIGVIAMPYSVVVITSFVAWVVSAVSLTAKAHPNLPPS